MKTTRIYNVPVTDGEITIVRTLAAADVMKHSCGFAQALRKKGSGVLIVNTGLSKRRFKEAACEAGIEVNQVRETNAMVSPGKTSLIIQTSLAGELSKELESIRTLCKEAKISVVVITGWEWTSSSYRRKEQLLFGLRQLLNDLDIAVVIYTQSPQYVTCGQYSRGGVGKLAMLAYDVVDYDPINELPKEEMGSVEGIEERKPRPVLGGGAQLGTNKINELPVEFAESEGREIRRVKEEVMALAA
ncbi:MAG TPA: hypothetical protein VFO76_09275 [Candidatus Kapabacteria bacterium]|nr:hypothetical protein [Candidatus Kapabacteria bacterium]